MRKLLIPLAALALAGAYLDAAAPARSPRGAPPPRLKAEAPEEEPVDDSQDVLYLGPGRPAVLRLHLRNGGKAINSNWNDFMAKFFAYLDRNRSGGLDRAEARVLPPIAQMQQLLAGNLFNYFPNQGGARIPFETLDADRDGKVTLQELKDYYRKNGAGPVTVQASYAGYNPGGAGQDPLTESLFKLLDGDKDGKLSKVELLAAEKALLRLDDNDDELISAAELGGNPYGATYGRVGTQVAIAQAGGVPAPQSTLVLLPGSQEARRKTALLGVVRTLLQSRDRDKDNKLTLEESGFPKAFFAKLDRNKDGRLDVLELARWLGGKADGEFTVRLGGASAMMMPGRRGGGGGKPSADRDDMSLTMGNVRVTVVPGILNPGVANARQFFLGQFRAVDEKRKGFLARRQLNPQAHYYLAAVFDLADRNGDGRLTEKELEGYLDVVAQGQGAQVSLALNNTGQGLFQLLDANADGQLSVRELRNAWARLERFDRDGDGCISREEFPIQFNLNVGPGAGAMFTPPVAWMAAAPGTRGGGRGPLWFRKMDRNGDGDVSRTEWLGSKADFDRIDANADGLISADEAEAADARARKPAD